MNVNPYESPQAGCHESPASPNNSAWMRDRLTVTTVAYFCVIVPVLIYVLLSLIH